MAFTIIRGGAIIGLRLCETCKDNYYEQSLEKKPVCQICDHKILDGVEVTICRICSLETCVCQHCGTAIASDDEKLEKKKRGKKKGKTNAQRLPSSDSGRDLKPNEAGKVLPLGSKVEAATDKPSVPSNG